MVIYEFTCGDFYDLVITIAVIDISDAVKFELQSGVKVFLPPARLSNQPQPAKSDIYGKIGRKTLNLAGLFLLNDVICQN